MFGHSQLFPILRYSTFPQIHNLTSEWQYLFDLAGVSRAMLEDQSTLQFILDTTYQLGGAPKKLEQVQQEALSGGKVYPSLAVWG